MRHAGQRQSRCSSGNFGGQNEWSCAQRDLACLDTLKNRLYTFNRVASLWYVHSSYAGSALVVLRIFLAHLGCLDAKRSGGSNPKLRNRRGRTDLADPPNIRSVADPIGCSSKAHLLGVCGATSAHHPTPKRQSEDIPRRCWERRLAAAKPSGRRPEAALPRAASVFQIATMVVTRASATLLDAPVVALRA